MRLIDADKLEIRKLAEFKDEYGDEVPVYGVAAEDIVDAPTVDAIVLPVKVGQTVWFIDGGYVKSGRKKTYEEYLNEGIIDNMVIGDKGTPQIEVCTALNEWIMYDLEDDFNKCLFATREAAEEALKAREKQ